MKKILNFIKESDENPYFKGINLFQYIGFWFTFFKLFTTYYK